MASLLDRFNKTVIGAEDKLADYRSIVASTGDFKRIEDIEVILNSWNNILLTARRTYMFDPEYGSNLYRMVFEPADEKTKNQIVQEVIESIRRYDNRASINDVSVEFLPNGKGFNLAIDVDYEGDTSELKVTIDESLYFNFFESTTESGT
jgi:phage baseplate assembly protein W